MALTMDNMVTVEGLEVMEIMDLTMEIVEDQEVMVIMALTMDNMVTVEGLEVMEIMDLTMVIMDTVTVEGLEVMETAMEDTTMETMATIMESRILFKSVLQYTDIDKINIV